MVLALSFARSVAPMAFALRFSVLPLIDSIMHLAFDNGVGCYSVWFTEQALDQECEIERSATNLQHFSLTKYFETEVQRHGKPKARARKAPDA